MRFREPKTASLLLGIAGSSLAILSGIIRLRKPRRSSSAPPVQDPLRAPLLNADQLEQHARVLAHVHQTVLQPGHIDRIQRNVDQNARLLLEAREALAADARASRILSPAAEWLLDNFYIVADQIHEIRVDLPQGYYQRLP